MEIKTIKDYYEYMYELFPELSKKDIERIIKYGFRSLYLHNSYGGDTLIKDNDFFCYIGILRNDSLKHFEYYAKKLALKIRILYKRNKTPWDGYYYFALSDKLYENYTSQLNKRGRKRKYYQFGDVMLYRILDECKVKEHSKKYIFKVPFISEIGYKNFQKDFISGEAELIITRDPQKFKDILVSNLKYDYIQ